MWVRVPLPSPYILQEYSKGHSAPTRKGVAVHLYTSDSIGLSYGEYHLEPKRYWQRYFRFSKHGWLKRRIPTPVARAFATALLVAALTFKPSRLA